MSGFYLWRGSKLGLYSLSQRALSVGRRDQPAETKSPSLVTPRSKARLVLSSRARLRRHWLRHSAATTQPLIRLALSLSPLSLSFRQLSLLSSRSLAFQDAVFVFPPALSSVLFLFCCTWGPGGSVARSPFFKKAEL